MLHAFDNVYELTETVEPVHRQAVIKGGAWVDSPRYTSLADAHTYPMTARSYKLGFRCAKSASGDPRLPPPLPLPHP